MSQSLPHPPAPPEAIARAFARAPFIAAREGGAPTVLMRGVRLRLAWANRAAAELFGASGYDALQRRLVIAGGPLSRRLSHVMATARIGAPPRLERLRFASGARVHNLTALCERGVDLDGEPTLILAFTGAEAQAVARGASWAEEAPGQPADEPALAVPPLIDDLRLDTAIDGPQPGGTVDGDHGLEDQRDNLRRVLGGSDVRRFAWRTDAEGALVEIDEALMRQLGLPLVHDEQTRLTEQVAGFDPSGAHRLQDALMGGATWSGIDILCPVLGAACLPVTLAASPFFNVARRFSGFRGFGRFDIAKLQPWRSDLRPVPPEARATTPPLSAPALPPQVEDHVVAVEHDVGDGTGVGLDAALLAAPLLPRGPEAGVPADGSQNAHNRAANVVQLWPAHIAVSGGRVAFPPMKGLSKPASAGTPEGADDTDGDDGQTCSPVEPDIEHKGALTSSEHLAFQEIGRALGAAPRRMTSSAGRDAEAPGPPDLAELPVASDNELTRHAAAIVDTMSVGLFVVRRKRVLFANDALREALRFDSHAELLDALALHFARTPPPDEGRHLATLSLPSAYGEEVSFGGSSRAIAWNGQSSVLWTLTALAPPAPAPESHAPVTAAGSQTAQTVEADLTSAMEVIGEAVAIIDPAGRLIGLNRQAERWFGRDREHVAGQEFSSLLPSESRAFAVTLLDQLKSDSNKFGQMRGELAGRGPDGSPLMLEMRLARVSPHRVAIVWRDLSVSKALERDLAQARRQAARAGDQQPEFLANVSHQVRTPLNAILGFAEIMMDERFGPLGNARYKDYLKDIHGSGRQVITLIDDLLDLSRIEAGKLDLRLGAIDINKVIVDCVAEAHVLAHRERIIVRTSFGARLPPVMADERSARQIIGNLLSNAIKFNEPGGQVIVSTASSDAASVVVRIRDTGIGMSDGDIASALQPFRQLAPTKNASGTGLGLPLTKALVGANGASLSMRSRPNEGTMVEVTFQATVSTPTRVPA